jgi:plastocyanin
MRKVISLAVVSLALVLAAPASTATATVQIKRSGFVPATVTINQDDSVTWTNADTIDHQVVANGGSFVSPILRPGKTYTHTFRSGGTFRYHDGLHPTLKGTVTVRGAPPVVTLVTSAPVVKYGTQVTLSGTVSNKKAGETVTIAALPADQTTKQVVATLQTGSGGAFSWNVVPQIGTQYQAQWKNLSESSVTVQVMPLIKLPAAVRGYFHFYVTAAGSADGRFAGHYVFLQRWSPTLARWLSYRKLVLGKHSGRIFPTTYAPRHARTSLRIFLPQDQAGTGYLETTSGSQPVRRR